MNNRQRCKWCTHAQRIRVDDTDRDTSPQRWSCHNPSGDYLRTAAAISAFKGCPGFEREPGSDDDYNPPRDIMGRLID